MPRIAPHVPLADRALAHADTHAESAEIIGALLERIDGLTRELHRCIEHHDMPITDDFVTRLATDITRLTQQETTDEP